MSLLEGKDQRRVHDPAKEFIYLASPPVAVTVLCVVLTVVWIFLLYPALLGNFSTAYLGGSEGDAGIYIWLEKHVRDNFKELAWFDTHAFYPYTKSLAFSDNFILPGVFFSALSLVTPDDIAAYNLTYLSLIVLDSLSIFLVAYSLTEDSVGAIFTALLGISLAPLIGQLGHPQLQCYYCFPLFFYLSLVFLRSKRLITAIAIGTLLTVTFLTSVYFAVFCAFLLFWFLLGFYLLHPRETSIRSIMRLIVGGLIGFSPAYFFVKPYLDVKEAFGERLLLEAFHFAATPLSYISFSSWSQWYSFLSPLSHNEAHLGVGVIMVTVVGYCFYSIFTSYRFRRFRLFLVTAFFFIVLCSSVPFFYSPVSVSVLLWLLLVGFGGSLYKLGQIEKRFGSKIVTNRDILALCLWCALGFFVISLGPVADPMVSTSFSPFSLLYRSFPGFEGVRAIGRAGIVSAIFLSMAFGIFLSQQKRKSQLRPLSYGALFVLSLLENRFDQYPLDNVLTPPPVIRKVQELLASTPGQTTVLVLPFASALGKNGEIVSWSDFAKINVTSMNWFSSVKSDLINGFSGQRTKVMKELPRRLKSFPDEGSIRELYSYNKLYYLIVAPHFYQNFDSVGFEDKLKAYSNRISLIQKDSFGNYLLALTGSYPLDNDFVLKAKAHDHWLSLSLATKPPCRTSTIVQVFEGDDNSALASLSVPETGEFLDFKIDVSGLPTTVSMRRFRFHVDGSCELLLRKK